MPRRVMHRRGHRSHSTSTAMVGSVAVTSTTGRDTASVTPPTSPVGSTSRSPPSTHPPPRARHLRVSIPMYSDVEVLASATEEWNELPPIPGHRSVGPTGLTPPLATPLPENPASGLSAYDWRRMSNAQQSSALFIRRRMRSPVITGAATVLECDGDVFRYAGDTAPHRGVLPTPFPSVRSAPMRYMSVRICVCVCHPQPVWIGMLD